VRSTPANSSTPAKRPLARQTTTGYNPFVSQVSPTFRVRVLFFGRLKEIVSHAEDSAELSEAASLEHLFAIYSARYPELAKYRGSLVASCNREFVEWETKLRAGDEVAFLPPVSGG
jgi:sulfur-carrier protein